MLKCFWYITCYWTVSCYFLYIRSKFSADNFYLSDDWEASRKFANRNIAHRTRGVRVPFLKESETCLKNRFCIFLDTQMSGYNLSSILEQVTTGSRVPKKRNPKPTVDFRFPVPGFSGTGDPPRVRFPRNGTRNWHPYTGFSTNNWRKLSGLSPIHSMDIHQLTKVQWNVANAFLRTFANYWRRAGTSIETNVLFVEKWPMTDDHSIYSVRHSTTSNSIYREIKKNSVNDTLKRFLEKTKEF